MNDYCVVGNPPEELLTNGVLDTDGLPPVGRKLENGDPYYR